MEKLNKAQEKEILENLQFETSDFWLHELEDTGYQCYRKYKTFEFKDWEIDIQIDLKFSERHGTWYDVDSRHLEELTIKRVDEDLNDFVYYNETKAIEKDIINQVNECLRYV